jgi:hypothetical protein
MRRNSIVTSIFLGVCLHICTLLYPTPNNITYRYAQTSDIPQILALEKTMLINDEKCIVFFPEPHQTSYLSKLIDKKQFFVAVNNETKEIVAHAKLYIVEKEDQKKILVDVTKTNRQRIISGVFHDAKDFLPHNKDFIDEPQTLYLYLGTVFTNPAYRKQGISTSLETFAFNELVNNVISFINSQKLSRIVILFGIALENQPLIHSYLKQFYQFTLNIEKAFQYTHNKEISFSAYDFIVPRFALSPTKELVRLPDGYPGLKCVFTYTLDPLKNHNLNSQKINLLS